MKVKVDGVLYEGAKVNFAEDGETVNSIELKVSPIEGEQIVTDPNTRDTSQHTVIYSLISNKKPGAKTALDALKNNSDLISDQALETFLKTVVGGAFGKVDNIGYLESSAGLSERLARTFAKIYKVSPENIFPVEKVAHTHIDNAVDWDQWKKESAEIQKDIINWLDKVASDPGPYKIKKTDTTQGSIVQRLHSKYNTGFHPYVKNEEDVPFFKAVEAAIKLGKGLLIVDDNFHSGTDFLKIFRQIEGYHQKRFEEISAVTQEEQEVLGKIKELEPYLRKGTLHDKGKQSLEAALKAQKAFQKSRENALKLNKAPSKYIHGYVLYKLDDEDLKL